MSNHEVFYPKPFDILRFLVRYSALPSCVKGAMKRRSLVCFRVPCGARDVRNAAHSFSPPETSSNFSIAPVNTASTSGATWLALSLAS